MAYRLRTLKRVALVALLAAAVATPLESGSARTTAVAATLDLRAELRLVSVRDAACPPGTRTGVLCPARTGQGTVPGLGRVTEAYTYFAEETPPSCPAGAKVLGYPVRWTIAGKGEIHFAVAERSECLLDAFTADQQFTITGGTGLYAGASGGGQVDRTLTQTGSGAAGSELWMGTLTVPGLEFDLTAPTITGARSKTVRAPRRATRVRVAYSLSATDDVDGPRPVVCRPPSGTRFRVGRTTVRCTATDNSGNVASATFRITVRRR